MQDRHLRKKQLETFRVGHIGRRAYNLEIIVLRSLKSIGL